MPRPPDALPGWLRAELGPTCRLAADLTETPAQAVELVVEALARETAWTDLPADRDPTPVLRAGLVRTYLRGGGEPARAAVVRREAEHLTVGEIASLVDRPPKQVLADLADLAAGPPSGPVADLAGAPPSVTAVAERYAELVPEVRRESGNRRRLVGAGLLVGALVVVGAVVGPTLASRLLPPDLREPGAWRFSHRIALADGWSIEQRLLTVDTEQTVIQLPTTNGDPGSCTVLLVHRVGPVSPQAQSHPVRVRGHDATYVDDPEIDPYVVWSYADSHDAVVSCSRLVTPESLQLQVADAVVFTGERMRLPFTLTARPAGYRLDSLSWTGARSEQVVLTLVPEDPTAPWVRVSSGGEEPADRCFVTDGSVRSAQTVGGRPDEVCLTAVTPTATSPDSSTDTTVALDEVSGLLRRASDPADPDTWFDATDLPR